MVKLGRYLYASKNLHRKNEEVKDEPQIDCSEVLKTDHYAATHIDIPAHRAEDAALDRIAYCIKSAGVHNIPGSGRQS